MWGSHLALFTFSEKKQTLLGLKSFHLTVEVADGLCELCPWGFLSLSTESKYEAWSLVSTCLKTAFFEILLTLGW